MNNRIYKTAKFWRVISYILFPILTLPFLCLLILPFISEIVSFDLDLKVYKWFFLPFSVIMIFVIIVIFNNTIRGKFGISSNKVYTIGLFNNKQIYFNEIRGYRKSENFIFIESKINSIKIKVSNYYENGNEIREWLESNYDNLDQIQQKANVDEILKENQFGWNAEEREKKLKKAKKTAKIINWLGGFIAIVTILFLNSFKYVILICVAYPIICLVVIIFSKGLIKIDDRKDTVYPTIFWAFFATSSVLLLRGLVFYNIFDYSNVWLPTILIAFGFILILSISNDGYIFYKAEKISSLLMIILIIIFGYSYGTVINLNCVLDNSKPKIFKTVIQKKTFTSGRGKSYYLKLEKWNNQKKNGQVSVTKEFYDKTKTNDTVTINLKKGKLNISWFELDQK